MCIEFWEQRHIRRRMQCRTCGMMDDHWTLSCPDKGQGRRFDSRGKDYQSEGVALDAGHTEMNS